MRDAAKIAVNTTLAAGLNASRAMHTFLPPVCCHRMWTHLSTPCPMIVRGGKVELTEGSFEEGSGLMLCRYIIYESDTACAAAGGATSLSMEAVLGRPSDIANILNGILAGLVGITSACSVVKTYSAVVIGKFSLSSP